mgnify:CR=1 FL=1
MLDIKQIISGYNKKKWEYVIVKKYNKWNLSKKKIYISLKIEKTAIGSVAEIIAPKIKQPLNDIYTIFIKFSRRFKSKIIDGKC